MTLGRDLISFSFEEEDHWANEASKPEALAFVNRPGLFSSIFVTPPSHHSQHQNAGLPVCSGDGMTPLYSCNLFPFLIRRENAGHTDLLVATWTHPSSALGSEVKAKPLILLDLQSPESDNTMSQGGGPRRCVTSPLSTSPFPALCQRQKAWRNFPVRAEDNKGGKEPVKCDTQDLVSSL